MIRTDVIFQTSLAPNEFVSQTLETKNKRLFLDQGLSYEGNEEFSPFLEQNGYFKKIGKKYFCKKYFCIWGGLKSCLKQCNNKIRSAISFAHRVISMHRISMLLPMRVNTTSKPGGLESIVKFIGRFRWFFFNFRLLSTPEASATPV